MISRHRRIIRIMTGLHPLSAARKGVDRMTGGGRRGGRERMAVARFVELIVV